MPNWLRIDGDGNDQWRWMMMVMVMAMANGGAKSSHEAMTTRLHMRTTMPKEYTWVCCTCMACLGTSITNTHCMIVCTCMSGPRAIACKRWYGHDEWQYKAAMMVSPMKTCRQGSGANKVGGPLGRKGHARLEALVAASYNAGRGTAEGN